MIYTYKGFHGCDSQCELEIISNLVIATQSHENTGTSITNMAEHLAAMVCHDFHIDPKQLIWIEHYPERGEINPYPESFDLVSFNIDENGILSEPRWIRISRAVVEALRTTHQCQ